MPSVTSGPSFVTGSAVRASFVLHPRFEQVSFASDEIVAHPAFVIAELGPVAVVELLDDLERPPPVQHVAANQFGLQAVGHVAVARLAQFVAGVTEEQIGVPHQLVKRVQVPAGAFDVLEGF